ncbi:MAG: HAD family hydrolase [Bacteroidia bacterium]|nr:HAD family hydrolase [Bacteroidia bacterium]
MLSFTSQSKINSFSAKAVFLDRDGTIIRDVDYPKDPKQVELLPGTIGALRSLMDFDYKLVVISNQSGIGRGIITVEEMNQVNAKLISILDKHEIYFDSIYYCPHAPAEQCNCRKPSPEMILNAAEELNINLALSFMVGDKFSDIESGKRAGCGTILLKNEGLFEWDITPDFVASNWAEVLTFILRNETQS